MFGDFASELAYLCSEVWLTKGIDDLGTNLGCFLLGNESSRFIYCFYQKINLGVIYSIIHPALQRLSVGHPLILTMADYKMLPFQPHR